MKKLSSPQKKYLKLFEFEYTHNIRLCDSPKNTSIATIHNLLKRGLIKHGYVNAYICPMAITDKGKEVLEMLLKEKNE
jgi:hypothetical protein